MREQVERALDTVRPSLQADGGYVELLDVLPDGVAQVRLSGTCTDCPMAQMAFRTSVERALRRLVPGIRSVEAV